MESRIPQGPRRRYVSRACLNCRLRKVKCSEERPCQRCRSADEACEYVASRRGRRTHEKRMEAENRLQTSVRTPHLSPKEAAQAISTEQQQGPARGPYISPREQRIFPSESHSRARDSYVSPGNSEIPARESQILPNDLPINSSGSHVSEAGSILCRSPAVSMSAPFDTSHSESQRTIRLLYDLAERVTAVEREYTFIKEKMPIVQSSQDTTTPVDVAVSDRCESEGGNTLDASAVQNHTSLSETIDVLDGTLRTKPQSEKILSSRRTIKNRVSLDDLGIASPCGMTNVSSPGNNAGLYNVASLRRALDIYFSYLNPNLPILNENQFRAQFENHLVTGGNDTDQRSKDLFIVLVNFIYAEAMLLSEHCPVSNPIPGWPEFCYAESILNGLSWLSKGNIQIIQCLLIKARFLSTIQRIRAAYDTMCKAVQISFHIGLHNQPRWSGLSPFETTLRQRIFWSMFYLDRGIALNAGLPYLLHESDFKIDFPRSMDDKCLFPNRPLPEDDLIASYIPYLESCVRWAKLCSRIWDGMFGANAPRPASEELIASLDAEILYALCQLPPHLRWDPSALKTNRMHDVPFYARRHMCLAHLHTNHLRLVMRHRSIVTLKCSRKLAEECVWIATSSIDAMDAYRTSSDKNHMYRHSSVMYLTAAIIPLICVIVQESNSSLAREEVIQSFNKALKLLQDIAPGFALAELMLRRLDAAVEVAKQAIERRNVELDHISEIDHIEGADIGQHLLDLFKEFERPHDEISGDQGMLFWTDGLTNPLGEGFSLDMNDTNLFAADVNNQFDWSMSVPIV